MHSHWMVLLTPSQIAQLLIMVANELVFLFQAPENPAQGSV